MNARLTEKLIVFGAFAAVALQLSACGGHGSSVMPPGTNASARRLIAASGPSGSFEQLVLQSTPTQYFELEESACCTAANIGSSGAGGTYTSSNVTYSVTGPLQGETSTAVALPGNSGTTALSMGVSLPNPATNGAFTVEDWVYPIFTPAHTSSNAYYTIWGYDGAHRLLISNQSTAQGQLLTQFGGTNFTSTKKLTANAWNQVVFVYDGTNESFYVNGVLDRSTAKAGVALSAAYSLGQYNASANYKLDGSIAQHMVFPSALSAAVIQSHYTAATTGASASPSASPSPSPSPTSQPVGGSPVLVQDFNNSQYAPATISVTFNAAPSPGDMLLVFFNNNGTTTGAANTYTPPAGWTQLDVDTAHTGNTYEAFYHIAGTGESGSYAFTPACACREHVWNAAEYSNVSAIDQHGFSYLSNATAWSPPSETPAKAGDIAVVSMMPRTAGLSWTNPAGWSVDFGAQSTWSTELLQQTQAGTSSVSESSTLSAASPGYAAIVLLAPSGTAPAAKTDWPTWGMSAYRQSFNPSETALSTSTVSGLHQIWSMTAGGVFTDEPVVAANVSGTSVGTADIVFVGDAHANLYALNAQTGQPVWTKTLQSQFIDGHATATSGCFDQPGGLYGIGGSPTIDRASSLIYTVDGMGNLYAFDLATGTQKVGPVAMWPFQNGVNITNDYGALNEDPLAGVVYVPAGAHCGFPNYGGVERYTIAGGAVAHFFTEGGPPAAYGGVWGPGGPVIDPRNAANTSMNNIYFGTGYGGIGAGKYAYSVVRLTESMSVSAANNPITPTFGPDLDFGDSPLVFTPASSGCGATLAAAESKNGILYLYNADSIGSGPIQTIQLGTYSESGINIGTAAYDPTKNLVFIQNGSDSSDTTTGILHGLVVFTVTSGCNLQLAWQQTVGPNLVTDGPPAPPAVANGVVYYADGPGSGCSPVVTKTCTDVSDFYAFNETNGAMLMHATLPGPLFTQPVVVNGHVYLTTWNGAGPGMVYAFGL